jgi:hypothetical protein
MSKFDEERIDALHTELERAQRLKVIPYFHIGRCSQQEMFDVNYVDVYIGIFSKHLAFETIIKTHIQKKYSDIVRVVCVEVCSNFT